MAKKTKRQKQRTATRRPGPAVARPTATAPTGVAVEAEELQPAPVTATTPTGATPAARPTSPAASVAVDLGAPEPVSRRRVERLSGAGGGAAAVAPRARPARGQPAGFIQPLESEDAAIPFDRVPYVPADLRRVAIIAGLMIALIIVADIIVSNVVK